MQEKLTIGYVTNVYARASDTFIRGEVLQLRALGHTVHTFSIRRAPDDRHISEEIRREQSTTDYILAHGPVRLLLSFAAWCVRSPLRMLSAFRLAWRTCQPGIRARIWQAAYLLEASYLAERVRRLEIQHLHNHIPVGVGTVTMLAAHLADVPYSMTIHGPRTFFEVTLWALPEKIRRCAFTACISHFCRSQCMAWSDVEDWHKLKIIHCGLDRKFLDAPPSDVPDNARLVCVARLSPEKGHLVLLEAAKRLLDEGTAVELVFAGDGPLRQRVEAAADAMQLSEHVAVTGWLDADTIRAELAKSRALVLPSFAEGLPVVLMEAMALGRPVISTWVAGIPELVKHGVNGWLVPPGDVDALAAAMKQALETPAEQLARMGKDGAERVRKDHDARKEAAKLAQLFRASINREKMDDAHN